MAMNNGFLTALYFRISRDDGDKEESDSIENQRKILTSYISNKKEFVVFDEFVDDGYTGTTFDRPAFQKMIAAIESGKVNCVIVKDLSRFGRDYIDMGYYLERYFIEKNIRFIAVNDAIDSFLKEYDLLLPVRNVFNEQYARDISKKVQSSLKAKQKEGEFIGAFASYGYKKDHFNKNKLIIDEYAASIVRRIYQLYIEGKGKIAIARILNEEGVLCPSEYKKAMGYRYTNSNKLKQTTYWTYSTIHKMLGNQMYIGNMVQGKTKRRMKGKAIPLREDDWIIVKNTHEAIIDEDDWNKVKILMKRESKQPHFNQNISMFAGFVKCGDCGRALAKKKGHKGEIYYYCTSYTRYGKSQCTPHKISQNQLEQIILEDLNTLLLSIKDLNAIVEQQKKRFAKNSSGAEKEIAKWEVDLARVQKIKRETYEDFKDNILSKEEYLLYKKEYGQKEDAIKSIVNTLKNKVKEESKEERSESNWLESVVHTNKITSLDRSIVADMIHTICVFEGNKITIVYNFSNERNNWRETFPKMC